MSAVRLPLPFAGRSLAFGGLLVTVDVRHARLGPRVRLP